MAKGWIKEPRRHSLSARGIKNAVNNPVEKVMQTRYDSRKSFGGKAKIISEGNIEKLKSYDTIVAEYDTKTGEMTINGWYSETTARHINEFLQEKGFMKMSKKEMEEKPTIKSSTIIKEDFSDAKESISLQKKWVNTDGWRGYEEPVNAFAGFNDTGNWDDSPYPTDEGQKSKKMFSQFLKKEGIPFKTTTGKTSNLFAVNHFFVTTPSKKQQAKELVAKYREETGDKNIWVN